MARELKEILTLGTKGSARRAAAAHASRLAGPLSGLYLSQLIPALLLVVIGVITIWSASISIPEANFVSHLAGIAIGLVAAVLVWRYDMRALSSMTTALFVLACILMVLPRIPGLGYEVNGMMGWVRLGPVRFQPSEPSKIVVIFLMASAAAQYNGKIETFRDYARLCGTLLVPLLLIMPLDLGTGLVIFFIGATIIIVSGAPRTWVLLTVALIVGVAALVIITSMIDGLPHILKEYQLNRLIVFVDPDVDPTNNGRWVRRLLREGLWQRHAGAQRVCSRGPDRLRLLSLRRAVWVRRVSCAPFPVHVDDRLHRASRHEDGIDVYATHPRWMRGHVDVPGPGKRWHVSWNHAHHGHSAALCELRIFLDGRPARFRGYSAKRVEASSEGGMTSSCSDWGHHVR